MSRERSRLVDARDRARAQLMASREGQVFWSGRLSDSALSTATAISALSLGRGQDAGDAARCQRGVAWLLAHANPDGGWGDTPASPSNLPTTLLALSALALHRHQAPPAATDCARRLAGPLPFAAAVERIYGADRTFAVPIRLTCALAGLMGWEDIPPLPLELAALPRRLFPLLHLQVVSYALPALIGVGLGVNAHAPPSLRGRLRRALTGTVLRRLAALQPAQGGFLDATPLTSFVALGLAAADQGGHGVAERCRCFLRDAQRPDGSWPIDTDLSLWLTTAAIAGLAAGGPPARLPGLEAWLVGQQQRTRHPYTGAGPGGWAWTWRAGGVPDADDTAGALIALRHLRGRAASADGTVQLACRWLLDLQNRDGGWPTFCRGWGRLPFDRSSPDLTAHVLRALAAWPEAEARGHGARRRALAYLQRSQRGDGAWIPLWFGNQQAPRQENPVVGTSRVLRALAQPLPPPRHREMLPRALAYLLSAQHAQGGWGGAAGVVPSIEETSLAIIGLHPWRERAEVRAALDLAGRWLVERVEDGTWTMAAPIGLYFAQLWYDDALYPVVWAAEALTLLAGEDP